MKVTFDQILMLLIILLLGLALLPQYQRPVVQAALERFLGPPPTTAPAVPTTTFGHLTVTTRALARIPRDYDGIKFLSAYTYIRPQIMEKYQPEPEGASQAGAYFKIFSEGPGLTAGAKILALEYTGDPAEGKPRFLSFIFSQDKLVKVTEKFFKSDPDAHLKRLIDTYGQFRYHEMLEGKDRYMWDDGGMQMELQASRASGVTVFTLQMKKFAEVK
ncbi:hypothetical protein ACFL1W_01575 [Candidatus Margulisiibacteriota bacterium]